MRIPAPKLTRGVVSSTLVRYWITLNAEPFKREVAGYAVSYGLKIKFFVHNDRPGEWRVTEAATGRLVAREGTKMLAVDRAQARMTDFLARRGLAAFYTMLAKLKPVRAVKEKVTSDFPAPIRFN